jgi:stalled ribosome rescue protein Dom34
VSGFHHAVIWIDQSEAKVFRLSGDKDIEVDVHGSVSLQRLHPVRGTPKAGGIPPQDTAFYKRIMGTLDSIGGIVITGPGNAKVALKAFLDHYRPHVAARVCAVETMDDPGADSLLAVGRQYFAS